MQKSQSNELPGRVALASNNEVIQDAGRKDNNAK